METRRMLVALAAASAVFIAYTMILRAIKPPPPPPSQTVPDFGPSTASSPTTSTPPGAAALGSSPAHADAFSFTQGETTTPLTLGEASDDLRIEIDPVGAGVSRVFLTETKPNGEYAYAETVKANTPYQLLTPVSTPAGRVNSYETGFLWVPEKSEAGWRLDDFPWEVREQGPRQVTFATRLRGPDGVELVEVTKRYEIVPDSVLCNLTLSVENLTDESFRVSLEQAGPVGIPEDSQTYSMRFLMAAHRVEGQVKVDHALDRNTLRKGEQKLLAVDATPDFVWTALTNKYFAVFTRPLSIGGGATPRFQTLVGDLVRPDDHAQTAPGDMRARLITEPQSIAPHGRQNIAFEIYAGAKDASALAEANPDFADRSKVGYVAAKDLDNRCWCWCFNFPVLTAFMTWLLETIHVVVGNYGVAIIILVIIVRSLLHPLAVFQQKSMYRMQDAMGRIQPRLNAVKEKYANDRVRQNQEMMKVYSEENVNPMAPMLGMAPLFIQMPIMISLWTALNTDIHLRHAPFFLWIKDLSTPDALYTFAEPLVIPLLGWHVPSFNLLPFLMGLSMALQQRYMPKPGQFAKREAAKRHAAENKEASRNAMGMTPEEQMRQQAMIAYMMSVMMPIMLYYFPSGLALYWMSSNVFGIVESLIIRRQLKHEAERRERGDLPVPKQRPPGMVSRLLRHMATQAEELQRKADELSGQEAKTGRKPRGDGKKSS